MQNWRNACIRELSFAAISIIEWTAIMEYPREQPFLFIDTAKNGPATANPLLIIDYFKLEFTEEEP